MLKGSIVALITPFLNNKIDFNKLEELLDFHLTNKTDGLLLLGTTAETPTLSITECHEIVNYCVNYLNNRITLMVGVCTNDTLKAVKDCEYYEKIGIKYFLVIPPYYNKTNEIGLYKHFEKIANSTSSEIIIYNIPGRTNINLGYDTIKKLSKIKNITGIKEANENIKESIRLFDIENFNVYCGNDEYILPFMSLGAKGFINVTGNIIPKEYNQIYCLCLNNNYNEALNIFNVYKKIVTAIFLETNPIGIKEAMTILSMTNDEIRLPLANMNSTNHSILKKEILKVGKYINSKV